MYFSWAWETPEVLLGILTSTDLHISSPEVEFSADMISIGLILFRIDFLINKQITNNNE